MAENDRTNSAAIDDNGKVQSDESEKNGRRTTMDIAESGNKFQQAIAAWRSLDLTKLVSSLDTTAEDLVSHQKESLIQRKELAAKTKEFRKLDDSQKLGEIKDLLKAYQSYIDVITNHSKSVTSAFMQAYSPLSEAPDPYPLLEASVESLITSEEVVPKLEAENKRQQTQVATLTSQLEEAEKQLESERTKRQTDQGSQDAKIQEVEKSWSAVLKEKEENWSAREAALEEKVEHQDRLLKELKASYEVNQRLERSSDDPQDAQRSFAQAAELEIANSELEKTNTRLAELESRNEQLRLTLAQSAGQAHSSSRSTAVEDDPAYLRLRSENSSLLRRLDSSKATRETEKSEIQTRLRGVERELATIRVDRDALQSKIQKWSDYDEVKRELDMLRAIEFATVDDSAVEAGETVNVNGNADNPEAASLEKLLVARNKKISDDLTELRVAHNELQQRFETLQEDMSNTNMELEKTRNLNATLENDIQKAQQEASNAFETMSVAGTYTSRYPRSTAYGSRRGASSPTSSIIGGFDPQGQARGGLDGGTTGAGILPMVTAQRDRFKKKISELEQDLQKQYQTVSSLRSEIASLQRDNLQLYEKTRYVATYNRTTPTASGASYGGSMHTSTHVGDNGHAASGSSFDRYRSAYESNLSPFAAFRGRESARAMRRMTLPERVVLRITKTVLATRASRNLFATYCLALHFLVLLMLFWSGNAGIERAVPITDPGHTGGAWQPDGFHARSPGD